MNIVMTDVGNTLVTELIGARKNPGVLPGVIDKIQRGNSASFVLALSAPAQGVSLLKQRLSTDTPIKRSCREAKTDKKAMMFDASSPQWPDASHR